MNAKDLITEHLDIWSTAQEPQKSGGRGREKKVNGQGLYGIKKLRELILDLAVRGKLVPQNPEDEPASVLLKQIAVEKARLIKEGKIKKQKKLPEITEEEKPFDLPEGWRWGRLGITGLGSTGKTPNTRKRQYYDGAVPFIGPGQITPDGNITDPEKTLTEEGCKYSVIARSGDTLMVCIGGSIGKSAIVQSKVAFNQQINSIHPLFIESKYLNTALNSPYFQSSILDAATGSATPIINRMKWEALLVPLSPLVEQHRIVAKIDELMALCDQLEQQQTTSNATHQTLLETLLATLIKSADHEAFTTAWECIATHFDILFTTEESIDQLKQTVLQLAVMGKLVPQNPEDEPASVLLEKIAREKACMIKEGKIKKQKKLPEITEEEKPFDLPDGWEWVRLGNLSTNIHYGYTASASHGNLGIKFLRITDIQNDSVNWETVPGCEIEKSKAIGYLLENNDILIARTGGTIGKSYLVADIDSKAIFASYLIRVQQLEDMFFPFIKTFLGSQLYWQQLYENSMGTGQPNVNATALKGLLFPLPTLSEQHRIVAKVDELMAICDQLKTRLHQDQTTKLQLADTIVNLNGGCHAG